MNNASIAPGKFVEISYILREANGDSEELEICPADEPFGFMAGEEQVLPAFEAALIGLKPGDSFDFKLSVEDAYGEEDEEAYVEVPKSAFIVDGELDESVLEIGEVVPMQTEDGDEVIGVTEVRLNSVVVDLTTLRPGCILLVRCAGSGRPSARWSAKIRQYLWAFRTEVESLGEFGLIRRLTEQTVLASRHHYWALAMTQPYNRRQRVVVSTDAN